MLRILRTGERTTWVEVLMALPLVLVVLVVVLAATMVVVMLVPMQRPELRG